MKHFNRLACIVTKSLLVVRDTDILARKAEKQLVKVVLSVTSLDRQVARKMEPRAAKPDRRLYAIEQLAKAALTATVMVAP